MHNVEDGSPESAVVNAPEGWEGRPGVASKGGAMRSRLATAFGRRRARRLAYYPPMERTEDLIDSVSRAAWFLTHSDFEHVAILVSGPSLEDVVWRVAPDMAPQIAAWILEHPGSQRTRSMTPRTANAAQGSGLRLRALPR